MRLRPATRDDAYALWIWANDPQTRTASCNADNIPWVEHVEWLECRLRDPSAIVLIAESEARQQPLGSIRFDTADAWVTARLSYVIAPESRGLGLSRQLVSQGVAWVRSARPLVVIRADVLMINPRSLHLFRSAGWTEDPAGGDVARFWLH